MLPIAAGVDDDSRLFAGAGYDSADPIGFNAWLARSAWESEDLSGPFTLRGPQEQLGEVGCDQDEAVFAALFVLGRDAEHRTFAG